MSNLPLCKKKLEKMPKRKLKTQENEVQIDGWPISSLRVFQIRTELRKCGLSSGGKKQDMVERLSLHRKKPDPFNSLPDELVLKIVKMATAFSKKDRKARWQYARGAYNHTYIIAAISRVSSRFNRIARDQALWSDRVALNLIDLPSELKMDFQEIVNKAVKSFLGSRVSELVIYGDITTKLSKYQRKTIAVNCPDLGSLTRGWPKGGFLWMSRFISVSLV